MYDESFMMLQNLIYKLENDIVVANLSDTCMMNYTLCKIYDAWCISKMHDAWYILHDAWCIFYDAWCMMQHLWCMMVQCTFAELVSQCCSYMLPTSSYTEIIECWRILTNIDKFWRNGRNQYPYGAFYNFWARALNFLQ